MRMPSRILMITAFGILTGTAAAAGLLLSAPARAAPNGQNGLNGHKVYMNARCYACHGEMGNGGVGPRFRENRFLGMGDYVVGQILVGRGVMPSFAHALNNQQIAAVASYIRTSWGNQFGDVSPDEVAKMRKQVSLHPPQGRPHRPPASQQPKGAPTPPAKSQPPGQAIPPNNMKQQ
ncbi:MAG TPA: cytochrome c [Pseudolabrys sp.]|nr:cytochrome c [Pseudolabrys sp.]